MEGVKVGDRVKQKINYGGEGGSLLPAQEGTVVYVHPEARFYTLEFTFPSPWGVRKIREAYPLPPDPARLAPAKDPLRHESGSHYKWDARAAMGGTWSPTERKPERSEKRKEACKMRVISIANFKGGTGKTVTACNVAAELAELGRRVLLIDADPQHNASDFFGADYDWPCTLTDVLEGTAELYWPDDVSATGREGLDILPADMGLLRLDLAAIANGSSEALRRLTDFLDAVREDDAYDVVIFDCPPSFTAASVAALVNSDEVILPTRVDAFSRAGVEELIGQIRSLGRSTKAVFRVLITMADRTNLCRQGAGALRESGLRVFDTEIRDCVKVGESTYARQPLSEYAPRSTAAADYKALTAEIVREATC